MNRDGAFLLFSLLASRKSRRREISTFCQVIPFTDSSICIIMATVAATTTPVDPLREKALQDYRKKVLEHREIESRLKDGEWWACWPFSLTFCSNCSSWTIEGVEQTIWKEWKRSESSSECWSDCRWSTETVDRGQMWVKIPRIHAFVDSDFSLQLSSKPRMVHVMWSVAADSWTNPS